MWIFPRQWNHLSSVWLNPPYSSWNQNSWCIAIYQQSSFVIVLSQNLLHSNGEEFICALSNWKSNRWHKSALGRCTLHVVVLKRGRQVLFEVFLHLCIHTIITHGQVAVIIVGRALVYLAVIKRWILLPSGSQFGQSRSKWEPKLQLCCVFLKWAPSSLVWERVYMLLEGTETVKNWILYRKRSWTLGIGAPFWCGNSVIRLWVHPSCLAPLSCSSTSSTIPPRLNNTPTWGQYPILCWTWGHK